MLWPSRRFVMAALALGTAPFMARAMAEERPDPWSSIARYALEYRVRLRELGPAADNVALWVPYPAETRDQRVLDAHIDSPWPERLAREDKYGNRMVYVEGKADGVVRDLVMRFVIERRPSTGIPASATAADAHLRPGRSRTPTRVRSRGITAGRNSTTRSEAGSRSTRARRRRREWQTPTSARSRTTASSSRPAATSCSRRRSGVSHSTTSSTRTRRLRGYLSGHPGPRSAFGEWRGTGRPAATRWCGDGGRARLRGWARPHEPLQPRLRALLPP